MHSSEFDIDEVMMELRDKYNQLAEWRMNGVLLVTLTDEDQFVPSQVGNVIPFPRTLQ